MIYSPIITYWEEPCVAALYLKNETEGEGCYLLIKVKYPVKQPWGRNFLQSIGKINKPKRLRCSEIGPQPHKPQS